MNLFRLFTATALTSILATSAYALDNPKPGKHDQRVRYVVYDPDNVTPIWTVPGGIITLIMAKDETKWDIGASEITDKKTIKYDNDGNIVILKPQTCLIDEPVTILMRKEGQPYPRPYLFEIHTIPETCSSQKQDSTANVAFQKVDDGNNSSSIEAAGGSRISKDALGPDANVQYAVIFRYPSDEAARRRAEERAAQERWRKAEAKRILQQSVSWNTKDPYSGERNYHYFWRGYTSMTPRWVWDNGFSTAMVFPGLQRIPIFAYMGPDGKETVETNFSMHGDTVILPNTHQEWILRDGEQVVGEVWDSAWNVVGSTPGTGTNSPYVEVKVKGHTQ
jgi:type IV secretion system protein VirB9